MKTVTRYKNLTEIIAIVVRTQPSVLSNVNIAATSRNFSYFCVAVYAIIVGACDPLASGIVTSADTTDIKLGRRIQNMITSSWLAMTIDTYMKSVGSARSSINYFLF